MKEQRGFFHKVPTEHQKGQIVKEPKGFFQSMPAGHLGGYFSKALTMGLVGKVGANRWVLFKNIHQGPTGYWAGKLFQNSQ